MPQYYEIKIKGHLDQRWSEWFAGMKLTYLEGDLTQLSGLLPDQAAVHGLLERIRDLNLKLVSVISGGASTCNSDNEQNESLTRKENAMSRISTFIKKHSVLIYFALTFTVSWGGLLLVIGGRGGIAGANEETNPLVYLAMFPGPTIAGILLTGLVYGRAGFREFLSRLFRWRVGARWYAVALLTAPLVAVMTLFALLPTSPVFLPGIFASDNKVSLILSGIVVGLVAGFFEELGWTGFAIPRLRRRHSVLATGCIVGLLWGVWHLLLFYWTSGGFSETLSLASFLPAVLFCGGVAPAFRVLMVWVYDHTDSLLVAMLMHASNTGGVLMIIMPPAIAGVTAVAWYLLFAVALWVLVVAGVQARQILPRQA